MCSAALWQALMVMRRSSIFNGKLSPLYIVGAVTGCKDDSCRGRMEFKNAQCVSHKVGFRGLMHVFGLNVPRVSIGSLSMITLVHTLSSHHIAPHCIACGHLASSDPQVWRSSSPLSAMAPKFSVPFTMQVGAQESLTFHVSEELLLSKYFMESTDAQCVEFRDHINGSQRWELTEQRMHIFMGHVRAMSPTKFQEILAAANDWAVFMANQEMEAVLTDALEQEGKGKGKGKGEWSANFYQSRGKGEFTASFYRGKGKGRGKDGEGKGVGEE